MRGPSVRSSNVEWNWQSNQRLKVSKDRGIGHVVRSRHQPLSWFSKIVWKDRLQGSCPSPILCASPLEMCAFNSSERTTSRLARENYTPNDPTLADVEAGSPCEPRLNLTEAPSAKEALDGGRPAQVSTALDRGGSVPDVKRVRVRRQR